MQGHGRLSSAQPSAPAAYVGRTQTCIQQSLQLSTKTTGKTVLS